ncbi:signal peptidase I SipW [Evansella cellulosilytica]|uniref:Signal peptidase I n=1 Tax=Evansella cellulosilytica (strain ATCC 21833 / DSM 2522 / FERM P-1141 / JCM 9156 / N-4) TaxID=649639 RepID=E6TV07_EVAC2|nr:signal peptidase I [Evansella cellulosilytica]ADU28590.1 peptidase S26B, signal peptidase [Evansella cellulosilytica DSM 2522]
MKYLKVAKKIASGLVTFTLFVSLIAMVFIVISTKASGGEPELFGYQIKTVLSGSMEPEFKTGSIIAVEPGGDMTRFQEGDIITFVERDNILITHRIVDVVHSGEYLMYETKGDANNAPDSSLVLSDNVVAHYTGFTIPYVGYVASFAQSREGSALLLIIPGLILFFYAAYSIWDAISQLEKKNKKKERLDKVDEVEDPI